MNQTSNDYLEEAFENAVASKEEIDIKKFITGFIEEDYVWMLIKLLEREKIYGAEIKNFFFKIHNFKDLKTFLLQKIKNSENICDTLEFLSEKKFEFLSGENFYSIKGNDRKISLILHIVIQGFNLKGIQYVHFRNSYILLLFIVHYHSKKLNHTNIIIDIGYTQKILEDIIKSKINLNKYINDPKFNEWCYSYILNSYFYHDVCDYYFLPQPNSIDDKKLFIEKILDLIYIDDHDQKYMYIGILNAIKKAWQQKCFRENSKTKKKYHIPLTQNAKDQLIELATFKNMTDGELLSKLIGDAFFKEMCDENSKKIY